MAEYISWMLPLVALLLIGWEIYRAPKRKPAIALVNAIGTAFVALVLCRGNVNWLSDVPIFIWWITLIAAGVSVAVAMWPRNETRNEIRTLVETS